MCSTMNFTWMLDQVAGKKAAPSLHCYSCYHVGCGRQGTRLNTPLLWLFMAFHPHLRKVIEIMKTEKGRGQKKVTSTSMDWKISHDLTLKQLSLFSSLTKSWDVAQALSIDNCTHKSETRLNLLDYSQKVPERWFQADSDEEQGRIS